jgi:hypothetical protein
MPLPSLPESSLTLAELPELVMSTGEGDRYSFVEKKMAPGGPDDGWTEVPVPTVEVPGVGAIAEPLAALLSLVSVGDEGEDTLMVDDGEAATGDGKMDVDEGEEEAVGDPMYFAVDDGARWECSSAGCGFLLDHPPPLPTATSHLDDDSLCARCSQLTLLATPHHVPLVTHASDLFAILCEELEETVTPPAVRGLRPLADPLALQQLDTLLPPEDEGTRADWKGFVCERRVLDPLACDEGCASSFVPLPTVDLMYSDHDESYTLSSLATAAALLPAPLGHFDSPVLRDFDEVQVEPVAGGPEAMAYVPVPSVAAQPSVAAADVVDTFVPRAAQLLPTSIVERASVALPDWQPRVDELARFEDASLLLSLDPAESEPPHPALLVSTPDSHPVALATDPLASWMQMRGAEGETTTTGGGAAATTQSPAGGGSGQSPGRRGGAASVDWVDCLLDGPAPGWSGPRAPLQVVLLPLDEAASPSLASIVDTATLVAATAPTVASLASTARRRRSSSSSSPSPIVVWLSSTACTPLAMAALSSTLEPTDIATSLGEVGGATSLLLLELPNDEEMAALFVAEACGTLGSMGRRPMATADATLLRTLAGEVFAAVAGATPDDVPLHLLLPAFDSVTMLSSAASLPNTLISLPVASSPPVSPDTMVHGASPVLVRAAADLQSLAEPLLSSLAAGDLLPPAVGLTTLSRQALLVALAVAQARMVEAVTAEDRASLVRHAALVRDAALLSVLRSVAATLTSPSSLAAEACRARAVCEQLDIRQPIEEALQVVERATATSTIGPVYGGYVAHIARVVRASVDQGVCVLVCVSCQLLADRLSTALGATAVSSKEFLRAVVTLADRGSADSVGCATILNGSGGVVGGAADDDRGLVWLQAAFQTSVPADCRRVLTVDGAPLPPVCGAEARGVLRVRLDVSGGTSAPVYPARHLLTFVQEMGTPQALQTQALPVLREWLAEADSAGSGRSTAEPADAGPGLRLNGVLDNLLARLAGTTAVTAPAGDGTLFTLFVEAANPVHPVLSAAIDELSSVHVVPRDELEGGVDAVIAQGTAVLVIGADGAAVQSLSDRLVVASLHYAEMVVVVVCEDNEDRARVQLPAVSAAEAASARVRRGGGSLDVCCHLVLPPELPQLLRHHCATRVRPSDNQWASDAESSHELVLRSLPGVNVFAAQLLLCEAVPLRMVLSNPSQCLGGTVHPAHMRALQAALDVPVAEALELEGPRAWTREELSLLQRRTARYGEPHMPAPARPAVASVTSPEMAAAPAARVPVKRGRSCTAEFCHRCGASLVVSASFCQACGSSVAQAPERLVPPTPQLTPAMSPPSHMVDPSPAWKTPHVRLVMRGGETAPGSAGGSAYQSPASPRALTYRGSAVPPSRGASGDIIDDHGGFEARADASLRFAPVQGDGLTASQADQTRLVWVKRS